MRATQPPHIELRFNRLRRTSTFRGARLRKWCAATLGVVGEGVVGQRVTTEAVLSGIQVRAFDFDVGKRVNQGTQMVRVGVPKVESVVAACDAICPGRAVGHPIDVRHAGVGELAQCDLIADCSDDPALAVPLTHLCNGLGIPLLRLAVDGSGEMEMGRVLCSHGGAGHSCQMCNYDFRDLFRHTSRSPCPGQPVDARAPTLAGGALAAVIAGCGLLQAQRLITGNDLDQVVDREILLDMTHWTLMPIERRRSRTCLSGHVRWQLTPIGKSAEELTLANLFAEARQRLGSGSIQITLEPYGHALCVEATCPCGARQDAAGTRWAKPPRCSQCHGTMYWFEQTEHSLLTISLVQELEIDRTRLIDLGFPYAGAMWIARCPGKRPLRLLLD